MTNFVLAALVAAIVFMLVRRVFSPKPDYVSDGSTQADAPPKKLANSASKELVDAYVNRAKECALPSVRLKPMRVAPHGIEASRIGGAPWWPEELALPKNQGGDELKLLAQINLEELPQNSALAKKGILQFFIASDDLMGLEFESGELTQEVINKAQNNFRVVYHPGISKKPVDMSSYEPLQNNEYSPISGEYSIKYEAFQDSASPLDYRWESLCVDLPKLDDESDDQVYEALDSGGSKIGGYAYFTQTDPRSYNSLGKDWELLLQIDTESGDGVDIMWGDCGVANFFIPKGSLEKMDFSEVWYNWDCC